MSSSHERNDGRGYPDGLRGEQIPLASRIVFARQAFHAMTSSRPCGAAGTVEAALAELSDRAGSQFDPAVVKALRAELAGSSGPERFLELDAETEQAPFGAGGADQRHAHGQPAD